MILFHGVRHRCIVLTSLPLQAATMNAVARVSSTASTAYPSSSIMYSSTRSPLRAMSVQHLATDRRPQRRGAEEHRVALLVLMADQCKGRDAGAWHLGVCVVGADSNGRLEGCEVVQVGGFEHEPLGLAQMRIRLRVLGRTDATRR